MRRAAALLAAAALSGTLGACATAPTASAPQASRPLAPGAPLAEEQIAEVLRATDGDASLVYREAGWRPIWIRAGRASVQARGVALELGKAEAAGLRAADYDGAGFARRLDAVSAKTPPTDVAKLDAAFTAAVLRYVSDLHLGRANPNRGRVEIGTGETKQELAPFVLGLSATKDVPAEMARAEPPFPRYALLKRELPRHRALAANAELVPPPDLTGLRPGGRHPGVPALRRWLEGLGFATPSDPVTARSDAYERALVDAVKSFQERHGLHADGVVGKGTAAALRVPMAARVRQIELALERWRWLPHAFPRAPIVVNIPEFRLYAMQGSGERPSADGALTMRVIVGEAGETETPEFSGEMEYVVFRPYWNVPYSIVLQEMIPKLRSDPGYLGRERLEIVSASGGVSHAVTSSALAGLSTGALGIRQRPGDHNSLGLVKFIFPNEENVYLHGTPARGLFARQRRDFSHGCIRVEDPVALAEHVLRDVPGWTRERIESAMHRGGTSQVDLAEPIPVYVTYFTAVARPGGVDFFEDLYGRDAALEAELATRTGAGSAAASQVR